MSKKKGIIRLVVLLAVIAFVVYTAVSGLGSDRSGSLNDISLGLDLRGGVSITYEAIGDVNSQDMSDTKAKLEKRVQDYSTEAQVYFEGSDRITVDIPGATDANAVLQELGKPGTLIFCTDSSDPEGTKVMDGNQIKDAQAGAQSNATTNAREYVVNLTLTSDGVEAFSKATEELAPKRGRIYIMYNGEVLSAPTVNEHIASDTCSITGMGDLEAAQTLASNIRIGALPVQLQEMRSQVVGAKLGQDAVRTSLMAGVIGLILVFAFMIIYYRIPGLAASIALVMYTAFVIVLLSAFNEEITLTLPGIAGIILGIGMAVDANCIIFARIREEIGAGKSVRTAIDAGFAKAFSAIIDGNVTTLIAAGVLYFIGSGTVKGFAQTLALGIVVSMFTALVITKLLLNAMYSLGMDDVKYFGVEKPRKPIRFVENRLKFFCISGAIILACVVTLGVNKASRCGGNILNYGLDFLGGTTYDITFPDKTDLNADLKSDLEKLFSKTAKSNDVVISEVAGRNALSVKTVELNEKQRNTLNAALEKTYGVDEKNIENQNISASVSDDMKSDAVTAVVIAVICMLIYIWFRFKDVIFAGSAVLALIHDVIAVILVYGLTKISVGNTFIACMLTIVGYSINATIVIFDRIRENLQVHSSEEALAEVVNESITQTLTRSINTSLTTIITVVVLAILGVDSVKDFAIPLLAGFICGGYSSVCITGTLWYSWKRVQFKRKKAKK